MEGQRNQRATRRLAGDQWRRPLMEMVVGGARTVGITGAITGRAIYEGTLDFAQGQALADELAAAAGLYMGKASGTPAVVASGVDTIAAPGGAHAMVRAPEHDLFRT